MVPIGDAGERSIIAMNSNPCFVVARHSEDVSWLESIPFDHRLMLFDKSEEPDPRAIRLENFGREANTYLRFITEYYDRIKGDVIFCQGNPFDHCPDFTAWLQDESVRLYGDVLDCTIGGSYDQRSLVHEYCRVFGLPVQSSYRFVAGAQFRVTAEQIHVRPREFYTALFWATFVDPEAAYTLERLWPTIFGI